MGGLGVVSILAAPEDGCDPWRLGHGGPFQVSILAAPEDGCDFPPAAERSRDRSFQS